ncbi:EAL domain-containing protein [Mesorhizobium sp. M1156]|uniref:EAL domain-containing protein n=1 Tax=Mesorhizobium sp. M1233 TaxID=2957072 RepID=UPI0033396304
MPVASALSQVHLPLVYPDQYAVAFGLKASLIAEGVETDDQVAFLRRNNCDEMQGYHFSRPVCAQDVEELLGGGRKD